MSMKTFLAAAAMSTAFLVPWQPASAAQPAPGPSVSGVCMLSRKAVLVHSKIGRAATARMRQLSRQESARLRKENDKLKGDIRAFRAKAGSMPVAERNKQRQALAQQLQAHRRDVQVMKSRLRLTRMHATRRILELATPIENDLYKQRHCGVLLNRNMVLSGNAANDLTRGVIQRLDGKASTIRFNLAKLPAAGKR